MYGIRKGEYWGINDNYRRVAQTNGRFFNLGRLKELCHKESENKSYLKKLIQRSCEIYNLLWESLDKLHCKIMVILKQAIAIV